MSEDMAADTSGLEPTASPTTNRRYIGRRFLVLRRQAGLTRKQVADALEISSTTLGRIEQGHPSVRFKQYEVERILRHYQAPPEETEILLAFTAETRNGSGKPWFHDYTERSIPEWFGLYVSLEDGAETIREYNPELIPGLLQTRSYAEAIMRVELTDEDEIQRRLQTRMDRQSLLSRPRAPQLEVILNEATLHRTIGIGSTLAREQLEHLLAVAQHSNVLVRLLPYSAGVHGGMAASGGFSLLRFPKDSLTGEPYEPPLAYVDGPTGAMYLTKPVEVGIYDRIWDDLIAKSDDPHTSRQAIAKTLEGIPK